MLRRILLEPIQMCQGGEREPERQPAVGKTKIDGIAELGTQHHRQLLPARRVDLEHPVGMPSYFTRLYKFSDRIFRDRIALPIDKADFLRGSFDEFFGRGNVSKPEAGREKLRHRSALEARRSEDRQW